MESLDDAIKEYRLELCTQADALGMESLTEDQQYLVYYRKTVKEE